MSVAGDLKNNEKSAQRDANTARALAVVRLGHRPPARPLQTGPITIHCAAQLASAQCNDTAATAAEGDSVDDDRAAHRNESHFVPTQQSSTFRSFNTITIVC